MRKRISAESKARFWRAIVGDPPGHLDLWVRVHYWRERLKNCGDYPVLSALESAWEHIDSTHGRVMNRQGDKSYGENPFDAFFFWIDAGFYPPPELLLALQDAFAVYEASRGEISLEETFFGPPKRKAGGFARQKAARFQRLLWAFRIDELVRKGHTKARAAEIIAEEDGGEIDPETIARQARLTRKK